MMHSLLNRTFSECGLFVFDRKTKYFLKQRNVRENGGSNDP